MAFHLSKIKFSQVAQIIFYDRKHSKTKTSPQNVFLLIRMTQERQRRNKFRWVSGGKWKSTLELLSECTKLRIDEKLVAPDPDMFGYRTFVAFRLQNPRCDFNHYESLRTFCSRTCTVPLFKGLGQGASRPQQTWNLGWIFHYNCPPYMLWKRTNNSSKFESVRTNSG